MVTKDNSQHVTAAAKESIKGAPRTTAAIERLADLVKALKGLAVHSSSMLSQFIRSSREYLRQSLSATSIKS